MQNKEENKPSVVIATYEPLPPEYKPYNPTKAQKRKLERLIKKKRS